MADRRPRGLGPPGSSYPGTGGRADLARPLAEIDRAHVDLVLLPDEPYPFTTDNGPQAFTTARPTQVSGRLCTWYGPSLLEAAASTA